MTIKVVKAENQRDLQEARKVRHKVFVEEQGVDPKIEIDEFEDGSIHFLLSLNDRGVAAGRLRKEGQSIKFERIACLKEHRGKSLGRKLMNFMEDYCLENYPELQMKMHSQESAIEFYKKLGWEEFGEKFYEAGIAHQVLKKK